MENKNLDYPWYWSDGTTKSEALNIEEIEKLVQQHKENLEDFKVWHPKLEDWKSAAEVFKFQEQTPEIAVDISIPSANHWWVILPILLGVVLLGSFMVQHQEALLKGVIPAMDQMLPLALGIMAVLFAVFMFMLYLYRAWLLVHTPEVRIRPLTNVLLLLIPFFNIYWYFKALHGWALQYNYLRQEKKWFDAPVIEPGPFLILCVLNAIVSIPINSSSPTLATFQLVATMALLSFFYICVKSISRAINYLRIQRQLLLINRPKNAPGS